MFRFSENTGEREIYLKSQSIISMAGSEINNSTKFFGYFQLAF